MNKIVHFIVFGDFLCVFFLIIPYLALSFNLFCFYIFTLLLFN